MPPIVLHMVLARTVADDLAQGVVDGERGAFYLGATSPDVRVITRGSRWETHFFDLDNLAHQDSVAELFRQHPNLAQPESLSSESVSFMAGYITHLTMDQEYICEVYRPFFGGEGGAGGDQKANLMDRLFQFDLDRQHRDDPAMMLHLREALLATGKGIEVGFLDAETLEKWRQVNLDMTEQSMDWDRIRGMIGRHLKYSGVSEPAELDRLLDTLPELLDETVAHITSERVRGFVEQATDRARANVARYLGCA
jgi:hypothetical protein